MREQVERVGAMLDVHLMIERPERHDPRVPKSRRPFDHFPRRGHASYRLRGKPRARGRSKRRRRDQPGHAGWRGCGAARRDRSGAVHDRQSGLGGQAFIEHSLDKIERLRHILGDGVALEVDGGIDTDTAARCRAAGANLFVAGSAIFGEPDPAAAYRRLVDAAGASDPSYEATSICGAVGAIALAPPARSDAAGAPRLYTKLSISASRLVAPEIADLGAQQFFCRRAAPASRQRTPPPPRSSSWRRCAPGCGPAPPG